MTAAGITGASLYWLWDYVKETNPLLTALGAAAAFSLLTFGTNQLFTLVGAKKRSDRELKVESSPAVQSIIPSKLDISVGEDGSFVSKKSDGLYKLKKTFNIELSNIDYVATVSDCKLQITNIDPEFGAGNWVLKESMTLAAGDKIYVPIARYSEASTQSNYHDDVIEVCMAETAPLIRVPLLQTNVENVLTIRATGRDTPFCEITCKLYIENDRFRIKKVISKSGEMISLFEAATLAYEAAEEAGVLDLTTPTNASPENKLYHFKLLFMVDDQTDLFGVKPPSTKSRLIPKADLQGHDLYPVEGESSQINLLIPGDRVAYTNVVLRRKDLQRVIDGYIAEARRVPRR
jgi:hypothetical protein